MNFPLKVPCTSRVLYQFSVWVNENRVKIISTVLLKHNEDNYFIHTVTNDVGITTSNINPRHGQIDVGYDLNSISTSFEYDAFGYCV